MSTTYVDPNAHLQAPAAEVAVLGAILLLEQIPAEVEALIEPADFADPNRGAVYAAMLGLAHAGKPTDTAAVISALDEPTRRAMNNGLQLVEFGEMAPVGSVLHHAEVVAEKSDRRRHVSASMRAAQLAREGGDDYADMIRQVMDAVPRTQVGQQRNVWDVLQEIIDPAVEPPGVKFGLRDLDDFLQPMAPGTVIAVGARSGVGKTTFALDVGRRAAYEQGKRVLFISIEMTDREVFTKILSAVARVDYNKLLNHHVLTPDEEEKVTRAVTVIGNGSLIVADVDGLTLASYRQLVREHKPDLVVIDFLAMCTFPKADRHELAISEFVYGVKRISAEEQCATMILSQFNRSADARTDKKPTMGDFKDSAALEHASHLALLLDRPDLRDPEEFPGEVHIYVGKQRNGPSGNRLELAAQLRFSRFEMMAAA